MNSDIQCVYNNRVWHLVDHMPGLKSVGCKWNFKKKTYMEENVHTFKAKLVANGFT